MSGKIVVFGGSGFLGSHVSDCLSKADYQVTIYDQTPSQYLKPDQKMIVGNILDKELVNASIAGSDFVYNFSGIAQIEEAADKPFETIENNILGSTIIMEACVEHKVKRFLFGSTIYVFSNVGSFYKASKQSVEAIIEAYNERYDLPYTILRYGSLYGQRAQKWNSINRYIHEAMTKDEIDYDGTGDERREFIHVLDAANLSLKVLKPEFQNERVTITGTQPMTNKQVLEMICEILGKKIKLNLNNTKNPYHYRLTPYQFSPKLGQKLISTSFVDLGQGLLQLIESEHQQINP